MDSWILNRQERIYFERLWRKDNYPTIQKLSVWTLAYLGGEITSDAPPPPKQPCKKNIKRAKMNLT